MKKLPSGIFDPKSEKKESNITKKELDQINEEETFLKELERMIAEDEMKLENDDYLYDEGHEMNKTNSRNETTKRLGKTEDKTLNETESEIKNVKLNVSSIIQVLNSSTTLKPETNSSTTEAVKLTTESVKETTDPDDLATKSLNQTEKVLNSTSTTTAAANLTILKVSSSSASSWLEPSSSEPSSEPSSSEDSFLVLKTTKSTGNSFNLSDFGMKFDDDISNEILIDDEPQEHLPEIKLEEDFSGEHQAFVGDSDSAGSIQLDLLLFFAALAFIAVVKSLVN